jgi:hypothetical protein
MTDDADKPAHHLAWSFPCQGWSTLIGGQRMTRAWPDRPSSMPTIGSGPDRSLSVFNRVALWANSETCYFFGQRRICGDNRISRVLGAASAAAAHRERLHVRVRGPSRHAPSVTTISAGSLILLRLPWNVHFLVLCSVSHRAAPSMVRSPRSSG